MKITNILLILILGIATESVWAQQGSVTSGGIATGSNGNISYSVGQTVYTTNSNATGTTSQGMQQAYEIFILGTDDFDIKNTKMQLYPNPTTDWITLKMEDFISNAYEYQILDMTGKTIIKEKIEQSETKILMRNFTMATYFLNVLDNQKILKSFKIIKTN